MKLWPIAVGALAGFGLSVLMRRDENADLRKELSWPCDIYWPKPYDKVGRVRHLLERDYAGDGLSAELEEMVNIVRFRIDGLIDYERREQEAQALIATNGKPVLYIRRF